MTMQHPASYPINQRGATRQSRRSPTPLAALKELMDSATDLHTTATRNAVLIRFHKIMRSDQGAAYLDAIIEYWFTNNYRSLLDDYTRKPVMVRDAARKEAVKAAHTQLASNIEKAIEQRAQIILLDWVLPNGKALRECTGRECATLSRKVGGWLAKIAAKVEPNQLVGDVLQEADVRKLFGQRLNQNV